MKQCIDCKEEKPLEDYYRHKLMADGHLNRCKECTKYVARNRQGKVERICNICTKNFNTTQSEVDRGGGKYCSRPCYYLALPAIKEKQFKDATLTYAGVHQWVKRVYGRPNYCEICKSTTKKHYDWSNKSGEYRRNVDDWQRLCRMCHKRYDNDMARAKNT